MAGDYVGKTDASTLSWLNTFAEHMSESPSVYHISPVEAAGIRTAVDLFATAYADSQDSAQRTPSAVSLKDDTRNAAVQLCRRYAQMIRLNAGINNQAKIDAGVPLVNPNRDPIYCPTSSPGLIVVAASMGAHTMRFVDTLNPESRGKPTGASEIQLFVAVADEPVDDPAQAKFYNKFTKNPIVVAFQHADNGKRATYFARWAGRRGDFGMWSNPVTMAIAA